MDWGPVYERILGWMHQDWNAMDAAAAAADEDDDDDDDDEEEEDDDDDCYYIQLGG